MIGVIFAVIIIIVVFVVSFDQGILEQVKPYIEQRISSESAVMKPVAVARDIARTADVNALQTALLQYRIENDRYPDTIDDLVPDFISENPTDPRTSEPYTYEPVSSGESFKMCILFESKEKGTICISPE